MATTRSMCDDAAEVGSTATQDVECAKGDVAMVATACSEATLLVGGAHSERSTPGGACDASWRDAFDDAHDNVTAWRHADCW